MELIESTTVMETELQATKRKLKQTILDLKQANEEKAEVRTLITLTPPIIHSRTLTHRSVHSCVGVWTGAQLAQLAQQLRDTHTEDQRQLAQLQAALDNKTRERDTQQTQTQAQVTDLQQTIASLQSALQEERTAHVSDCQSLNQDMQILHATVQQQKQQLQSQHQSVKQLQATVDADKQRIAELQRQCQEAEETARQAQAQLVQRRTELEQAEAAVTKEKQAAKQHLQERTKWQDECEQLRKSLEQESAAKRQLQEMLEQQSNFDSDQTQVRTIHKSGGSEHALTAALSCRSAGAPIPSTIASNATG